MSFSKPRCWCWSWGLLQNWRAWKEDCFCRLRARRCLVHRSTTTKTAFRVVLRRNWQIFYHENVGVRHQRQRQRRLLGWEIPVVILPVCLPDSLSVLPYLSFQCRQSKHSAVETDLIRPFSWVSVLQRARQALHRLVARWNWPIAKAYQLSWQASLIDSSTLAKVADVLLSH